MRLLIVAVAGAIVSSSVAWSKDPAPVNPPRASVELAQQEVPGAAFLFPTGKVTRHEPGYESGKFQIQFGERGRAQIGWITGAPLSVEQAEATLVNPIRQAMGLSIAEKGPVRVAGNQGSRWVLRSKTARMILSVWSCGRREFHLIVGQADEDPSGLDRRIRDSFVCKPDPAREAGRASPRSSSAPARSSGSATSPHRR